MQIEQERVRAHIKAYETLAVRLDDLHSQYRSYLIFLKAGSDDGMDRNDRQRISDQFRAIGQTERDVLAARRESSIAAAAICQEVDEAVDEVISTTTEVTPGGVADVRKRIPEQRLADLEKRLADLTVRVREEGDRINVPG
jgi:hypothetical protein